MGGRPLEDDPLVERARRGDVYAYEELVRAHGSIAFRVAYLIARSEADAEDAVQEAFVKAYYALGRFRSGSSFRPWLLAIVSNEARNRRRSSGRRENLAARVARAEGGGRGVLSGDAASSPEGAALAREDADALGAALDRLRDPDREVLSLRYLLDLSEAEIAAALGCARGTVKSRLSRALGRLREQMPASRAEGVR